MNVRDSEQQSDKKTNVMSQCKTENKLLTGLWKKTVNKSMIVVKA